MIPFWFSRSDIWSVVRLYVAKMSTDERPRYDSDLRILSRAVVFSLSRVIESWRFILDRSFWVTMWSGYLMSKISQIYC